MKEFNENPFKKDTPVTPFSNGSEAESWMSCNCDHCVKYENESTKPEDAKCKLSYYVSLGFVTGGIPLWAAKDIGCDYDPLYGSVYLAENCREKRTGNEPF